MSFASLFFFVRKWKIIELKYLLSCSKNCSKLSWRNTSGVFSVPFPPKEVPKVFLPWFLNPGIYGRYIFTYIPKTGWCLLIMHRLSLEKKGCVNIFRTKHKICILAYHILCFCVFVFLGMLHNSCNRSALWLKLWRSTFLRSLSLQWAE